MISHGSVCTAAVSFRKIGTASASVVGIDWIAAMCARSLTFDICPKLVLPARCFFDGALSRDTLTEWYILSKITATQDRDLPKREQEA